MPKSMVPSTSSTVSAPDSSSLSRSSHGNDVSWSGAERASLPPWNRSGSFNLDHDPNLPTSNDDFPRALMSMSSSTGTSRRPSTKRQRNRQQLSCVACHLRKQACDKVVPCSRCIKRGVAHECRIEGRSNPPLRSPRDHSDSSTPRVSPAEIAGRASPPDLAASVASGVRAEGPEGARLPISLPSSNSIVSGAPGASPTAAYEASRALGPLGRTDIVTESHDLAWLASYAYQPYRSPSSMPPLIQRNSSDILPPLRQTQTPQTPLRLQHSTEPHVTDLVAALPCRQLSDFLLDRFFSPTIHLLVGHFCTTRKDTFMHDYRAVLSWKDSITAPSTIGGSSSPPTTLSYISLLNIVLATGLQYLADKDTTYVGRFTADYRVIESSLRVHSKMASDLSESEEPPDLNRVEAIMLQALYFQNCGRPNIAHNLASLGVRAAQALGMHHEPSRSQNLLPYEAEVRRRLWWSIYCHDRRNSIALGRPYIIHDRHCDVNITANADLDGLSPLDPAPIQSRPLTEYTKASVKIFTIELCRLGGGITDYMQSSQPHDYTDILALDDMFVAFESNLPPHFDVSQRATPATQEGAFLNFSILTYRIQMHRRYLLRKVPKSPAPDPTAQSRLLAVQLSQRLIATLVGSLGKLTREQMRYFTVPFHVFEGAATLAIATLQTPSDQAFVELNDRWIVDARDALVQMGDDNVTASEAVRCLDALRYKISTIVPPRTRLAPVHPPREPLGPTITNHSASTTAYSNGRHASTSSTSSTNSRLGSGLGSHPPLHSNSSMSTQAHTATDTDTEYEEWWLRPEGGESVWPLGQGALEFNQTGYWTHLMERLNALMPPTPPVLSS